ncbi:MAG: hypothetical protein U0Q16_15925 [Bryobacteraceae bacterium]
MEARIQRARPLMPTNGRAARRATSVMLEMEFPDGRRWQLEFNVRAR